MLFYIEKLELFEKLKIYVPIVENLFSRCIESLRIIEV